MRRRVAETCSFFGMGPWFRARTAELSGGQRQLLALASTLAMRPRLLLLDEPTSMLDPLAEKDFLAMLFRVNRELGVTVVVATHAPETMLDYATCAFELADGCVREVPLEGLRPEPPRATPYQICPRVFGTFGPESGAESARSTRPDLIFGRGAEKRGERAEKDLQTVEIRKEAPAIGRRPPVSLCGLGLRTWRRTSCRRGPSCRSRRRRGPCGRACRRTGKPP